METLGKINVYAGLIPDKTYKVEDYQSLECLIEYLKNVKSTSVYNSQGFYGNPLINYRRDGEYNLPRILWTFSRESIYRMHFQGVNSHGEWPNNFGIPYEWRYEETIDINLFLNNLTANFKDIQAAFYEEKNMYEEFKERII